MTTIAQTTEAWTPQGPITGLPRFLSYMRYPVFSREWLINRGKLFGVCAAIYYGMYGAIIGFVLNSWSMAALYIGSLWVGIMAAAFIGPLGIYFFLRSGVSAGKQRLRLILNIVGGAFLGFVLHTLCYSVASNYVRYMAGNLPDDWRGWRVSVSFNWIIRPLTEMQMQMRLGDENSGWVLVLLFAGVFSVYLSIGGGFALRSYFTEQRLAVRAKEQRELAQLKLQKYEADQQLAILQAQIEPHFLFNTLSSVRALVKQDAERAAAMLDGLADYLRITLPKLRTTDAVASLGEQLDICQRYLQLMQLRMGERFSYLIDVPDVLRQLQVPPLLLLPLVENAIKHGVEPKPGNVSVTIMARQQDNNLLIEISDDGAGLNVGMHAALNSPQSGQGVGLDNVRRQLQLRFGERATLDISGRAQGGVLASLTLPV